MEAARDGGAPPRAPDLGGSRPVLLIEGLDLTHDDALDDDGLGPTPLDSRTYLHDKLWVVLAFMRRAYLLGCRAGLDGGWHAAQVDADRPREGELALVQTYDLLDQKVDDVEAALAGAGVTFRLCCEDCAGRNSECQALGLCVADVEAAQARASLEEVRHVG